MGIANIERQTDQINLTEYFGGDIARESGTFVCGLLASLSVYDPRPPRFEDEIRQQLSNRIIGPRELLLSDRSHAFNKGFFAIRDFAKKDFLPFIQKFPKKTDDHPIIVGGALFHKIEFFISLSFDPTGISIFREVENRYRNHVEGKTRVATMEGADAAVEIYSESVMSHANFRLDEINKIRKT